MCTLAHVHYLNTRCGEGNTESREPWEDVPCSHMAEKEARTIKETNLICCFGGAHLGGTLARRLRGRCCWLVWHWGGRRARGNCGWRTCASAAITSTEEFSNIGAGGLRSLRHLSQSPNRASVFNGVLRKKTISCCEIISFPVRMSQDRGDYQKEGRGISGVSWPVHIFCIGHS